MIKETKFSNKLLVKVFSTEEAVSTCSQAIIELSPELIKKIKALKQQLNIAKATLGGTEVYQINSFDYRCDFVNENDFDEDCTSSEILETFEEIFANGNEPREIVKVSISEDEDIKMVHDDVTILYVSDSGFKFSCYIKHTSIRLDTTTIPYEFLETPELTVDFGKDYIRIYDGEEEVVGWDKEEWEEDSEVVFSIANAIKLATTDSTELYEVLGKIRGN